MTAQPSDLIKQMLARRRPGLLEQMQPAVLMERNHGIRPGKYACAGCNLLIEESVYPADACPHCGLPFPVRCSGKGCSVLIQPRVLVSQRYPFKSLGFAHPEPLCPPCADQGKAERARALSSGVGGVAEQIPAPELAHAQKWECYPWRADFETFLDRWLDDGLGKSGPTQVYIWSAGYGSGKTVAAARAGYLAGSVKGLVSSMVWTNDTNLHAAHEGRYGDDKERSAASRALIETATSTPFLVLDELFGRKNYTEKLNDCIGQILRARFEARRPTVFTSNKEPDWGKLDHRLPSRWSATGVVFHWAGPDLRQRGF